MALGRLSPEPPLKRGAEKQQVKLRIDPDVLDKFRAGGGLAGADQRGAADGGGVIVQRTCSKLFQEFATPFAVALIQQRKLV